MGYIFLKNTPKILQQVVHLNYINRFTSTSLKSVLASKISNERKRIVEFRQKYGMEKASIVTINSIYDGDESVNGLIYETAQLDPSYGIRFRGFKVEECRKTLPRAPGGNEPLPEALFWLLMTGDIPTAEQTKSLSDDWGARSEIPWLIINMIKKFPQTMHPLVQLANCIDVIESKFMKAYSQGVFKDRSWEYVFDDTMDLIAKIPSIASHIYNNICRVPRPLRQYNPSLDWAANFVDLLSLKNKDFHEFMRLYLTINSGYKLGPNVSNTIGGTALSDPYKSFIAEVNGLVNSVEIGHRSQEFTIWFNALKEKYQNNPTEENIQQFVQETINQGKSIPGFGHDELEVVDPCFTCIQSFAQKHMQNDPSVKLISDLNKIVPNILLKEGKIKHPWATVDVHSGVVFNHYGLKQNQFYPVVFAVSRTLGMLASLVWDRILGIKINRSTQAPIADSLLKTLVKPIPRPKSKIYL